MTLIPFFARFSLGYYLNIVMYFIVLGVTIRILLDNRNPSWSISMLLILYFIPILGLFIYFFNGVDWKKRKIVKHIPERIFKKNLSDLIEKQTSFLENVPSDFENDSVKIIRMLLNSSGSIMTMNNACTIFNSGEDLFKELMGDLKNAERSIHMEYFIWRSDELGQQIKDILISKAKAGVEVRLLFDGVGCFRAMSLKYKRELRKAGIKIRYFLDPLNPFTGWLLNYCNHRKILVIDGKTGFTGGMNIGQEYIDGGKRFETWRDTHMRLEGDTVNLLQAVFMADWENSGGKLISEEKYIIPSDIYHTDLPMQIITSGPDSDWHSLKELFFTLISNANEEVFIASPYFVIDSAIEEAIITAALSGVRIKIIMCGAPPDKWIPFWVAQTYYERLIAAGAEIYQYQKGFYHSKFITVDSKIATLGTCNMDIRSFQLHYEINAMFYDSVKAEQLRTVFMEDLSHSRKVTLEDCERLSFLSKLRNSIFRIFSPLL